MLYLSFMNLFRSYRRTIAVILTVALGTGVLFSFKGFINGVLYQYRESTIHAVYGNGQLNTKGYRETVYAKPWKHWITDERVIETYLKAQPEVEYIFPRINFSALLKKDDITISGQGQGIDGESEAKFFDRLNIISGTQLTDQPNGILLGSGLANALGLKVGDYLKLTVNSSFNDIMNADVVVVGIFNTGSVDFDSRIFRIQIKEAKRLMATQNVELIAVGLRHYTDWDVFAKNVVEAFPELEATSFAVLDKIYYQHSVDWLNAQFGVIQMIILSIVLLGIFNSISAAILERKQEIGNFRANGHSVFDVMKLITLEGTFLGLLGSCLGMALTYVVLKTFLEDHLLMPPGPGMTRPFFISFLFDWSMVVTCIAQSAGAAVIASILAGIKVAKMPIAEALRS